VIGITRIYRALLAAVLGAATLVGSYAMAAPSEAAAAAPSFVQKVTARGHGSSLGVTPGSPVTVGDRLVVEVGIWNSSKATAASVTDSAGNTYTELTHFQAADGTEMSVWTAPVSAGGGSKPTITVKPTATADIGVAALEYAGLSAATGSGVLDVQAHATGLTTAAATVSSGATPATTGGNELAIGFYADSGFGDTLTAAAGYTSRVNLSPTSDMELLAEDQGTGQGATPAATTGTGPSTYWLMATLVLKPA
jgi:hypothetical protein